MNDTNSNGNESEGIESKLQESGDSVQAVTTENDSPEHRVQPNKILIGAVVAAVALIVFFKMQKDPVVPRKPASNPVSNTALISVPESLDFLALVESKKNNASIRCRNTLQLHQGKLQQRIRFHEGKLAIARKKAATKASEYTSCGELIYELAWDQINDTREAEKYLKSIITARLSPTIVTFNRDISELQRNFHLELYEHTITYANDLAQIAPSYPSPPQLNLKQFSEADLNKALDNLGWNGAGVSVAVAFEAYFLYKQVLPRIVALAQKLFAKQITKAVVSVTAAAVDGPLPIGDIIGGIGLLWTAWDIYHLQEEFEKELNVAIDNSLDQLVSDYQRKVQKYLEKTLSDYQEMLEKMGDEALASMP